jgi:AMP-binding enzyme
LSVYRTCSRLRPGRPKGVRRPLTGADPDDAAVTAAWFFHLFGLAPFDGHVHLCGSPLYHTAVLNFAAISIQLGHPVVLMDGWDTEEALALIERHRVTHTHAVPTQFRRMLALPGAVRARYDMGSLRAVIHSAAPCPQQVKQLNGTITTLTERYNGSTWSVVASPSPGGAGNDSLAAVASPGGPVVFAAGAHEISGQCCLRALGLRTASG